MNRGLAEAWFNVAQLLRFGDVDCICFGIRRQPARYRTQMLTAVGEMVLRYHPTAQLSSGGVWRVRDRGAYGWSNDRRGREARIRFCTEQIKKAAE